MIPVHESGPWGTMGLTHWEIAKVCCYTYTAWMNMWCQLDPTMLWENKYVYITKCNMIHSTLISPITTNIKNSPVLSIKLSFVEYSCQSWSACSPGKTMCYFLDAVKSHPRAIINLLFYHSASKLSCSSIVCKTITKTINDNSTSGDIHPLASTSGKFQNASK